MCDSLPCEEAIDLRNNSKAADVGSYMILAPFRRKIIKVGGGERLEYVFGEWGTPIESREERINRGINENKTQNMNQQENGRNKPGRIINYIRSEPGRKFGR